MVRRLDNPSYELIYELDKRIDTIEGLDHLHVEIHSLSANYPQDEHHLAVRELAETALAAYRADEVANTKEIKAKERRLEGRIDRWSGVDQLKTKHRFKLQDIRELDQVSAELFNGVLSEAKPEERDAIQGIVQRKVDKKNEELAEIDKEMAELTAAADHVRTILERRIPKKPDSLDYEDIAEVKIPTRDPAVAEYMKVVDLLRSTTYGGINDQFALESELIKAMYPDLYRIDRPEAYKKFDELYERFGALNQAEYHGQTGIVIKRGRLHQSDQGGSRALGRPSMIYRTVSPTDVTLKSPGVRQRIEVDDSPHIIIWDGVSPKAGG